MKRPLFWLSILLALGIIAGRYLHLDVNHWFLLFCGLLFLAWFFFFLASNKLSLFFLFLSSLTLGGGLFTYHQNDFQSSPLFRFSGEDYLDFRGKILQTPTKSSRFVNLKVQVKSLSMPHTHQNVQGRLKLTLPCTADARRLELLLPGDEIEFGARLLPHQSMVNFSSPDPYFLLQLQGIHRRAFTKSSILVRVVEQGNQKHFFHLRRLASSLRIRARKVIEENFSTAHQNRLRPAGAILLALLLGEREQVSPEQVRQLQEAGLFHLLAISGAHLAIITYFLFLFFRLFGLPKRVCLALLIPLIVFFVLFIEERPSVLRAATMTILFLSGKLIWKNTDLRNTLGASAFFLLLRNPSSLFNPGFQLTFGATLSIIIFFSPLRKHLPSLPWRISDLLALTGAAQLGVLPILAHHFHRLTLIGFLLNLPAVPLVGIIMGLGYLTLLLSFLPHFIHQGLVYSLSLITNIFINLAHTSQIIDFLTWRCPSPSGLISLSYYIFLGAIFLCRPKKLRVIAILLFLITLFVMINYPFSSPSPTLRVTFLDVGQGQSILVEFPGRQKMLIDGGGLIGSQYDIGENVISPFLWHQRIKTIDYLVLTHAHPDHFLGLLSVVQNFKIKNFWTVSYSFPDPLFQKLINLLSSRTKRARLFKGKEFRINGVELRVLSPSLAEITDNPRTLNDTSLVLRLTYSPVSLLFPADITKASEAKLVMEEANLAADILQAPHHGSRTSSHEEFLTAVNPIIAVASAGSNSPFLPHPEVKKKYHQKGIIFLATPQTGAVEITVFKEYLSLRTAKSKETYRLVYAPWNW